MPFGKKKQPKKDDVNIELYTIRPGRFMRWRCRNCKRYFHVDTEAEENYTTDDALPPIPPNYCPDCAEKQK